VSGDLDVLYLFRDSPLRRDALRRPAGHAHRYVLFGLDQHVQRGVRARHNLQRGPAPAWAGMASRAANALVTAAGGYGGDFARVLPALGDQRHADVTFSTGDTVGLPLAILRQAGIARGPAVYAAIGLPERLARLRGARARRLTADALRRMEVILAYSRYEIDVLRRELGAGSTRFEFVPFGVDTRFFAPVASEPDVDVVSVGADPHRDFPLLVRLAARRPDLRVRIVATAAEADALGSVPANVELETDVPFDRVRDALSSGRVVALPVRENSYSGATTVLLQALALGKSVVVSRTAAIASGYGLEDGGNCLLVAPGDEGALAAAVGGLLRDEAAAAGLGRGARALAEGFSWDRYADAVLDLLRETAALRG
jgi:glycosyltransferase involved in cell wall biosynthesis